MNKISSFICLLLIISACASPANSFIKGRYANAYILALQACQKNKCTGENRRILEKSLATLLEKGRQKLEVYEQSSEPEDWEAGTRVSYELQLKIEESMPYIDPVFTTQLQPLWEREVQLRQKINAFYKKQGMDQLANAVKRDDPYTAVQAIDYFNIANYYALEPINIDSLLDATLNYGPISSNIKIETVFEDSLNQVLDRKFKDLESYSNYFNTISYDKTGKFDCVFQLSFDSLEVSYEETKDSLVFPEKEMSGNSEEMNSKDPSARVIARLQTKTIQFRVDVRIKKGSDKCHYNEDTYYAEMDSEVIDYTIDGDPSIVPDSYINYIPPRHLTDDTMLAELIDIIVAQFEEDYLK